MLSILPIETKEEQARIMSLCSIPYRAACMAYAAYDDGRLVGGAQFYLKNRCCFLTDLCNADGVSDEEALFIMGRGLLNFADRCGLHDAYLVAPEKIDERLRTKIGFFPDDEGKYYMNLRGFFDGKHEGR